MRIVKAGLEDKDVVRNLMQHYLHDLSPYTGEVPDANGHYDYGEYFNAYWEEDERRPYLFISENNQAFGFAFVRELSKDHFSVAEFFIEESHRRSGLGRNCAESLFKLHPGKWEIAQIESNRTAIEFWRSVVDRVTRGNFVETQSNQHPCGPKLDFEV